MKKMYLFAAAVALAASLTACGSKAPVDNAGTQAGEETTKQEASGTSSGDKKTVTFWAWDKEFNIAALEMAKEIYETDHPDVEINIVEVGQNDVVQKLNTGLGSGSLKGLPNAVPIEDYRIQSFLKSYPGAFMDLTSEINYDNFAAYKKGPMTLEGKSYGIPWDNGAAVLYYRKDMIEQAGYTEEDMQDLTWSKFIEMGKKIKEATGKKMISMDPSDIELMKLTMQSAGTWFTKEDGTTPDMENNAALRECLQIIKTITDGGPSGRREQRRSGISAEGLLVYTFYYERGGPGRLMESCEDPEAGQHTECDQRFQLRRRQLVHPKRR